jgi:hypothetical protein
MILALCTMLSLVNCGEAKEVPETSLIRSNSGTS